MFLIHKNKFSSVFFMKNNNFDKNKAELGNRYDYSSSLMASSASFCFNHLFHGQRS